MQQKSLFEKLQVAGRMARYMDAVLVVVFSVFFYQDQDAWWWAAASALCLVTAVWGPVERGVPGLKHKMVKHNNTRK